MTELGLKSPIATRRFEQSGGQRNQIARQKKAPETGAFSNCDAYLKLSGLHEGVEA